MNIGDCYIIKYDSPRIDLGLIYIGETTSNYYFTPLNFPGYKFDGSPSAIFDGTILTSTVLSGPELHKMTGITSIKQSKNKPSFFTDFLKKNKPFINLRLNIEKISLSLNSASLNQIIISSQLRFSDEEMFKYFDIHGLTEASSFTRSELTLLLDKN